jgi:hypothetical protein
MIGRFKNLFKQGLFYYCNLYTNYRYHYDFKIINILFVVFLSFYIPPFVIIIIYNVIREKFNYGNYYRRFLQLSFNYALFYFNLLLTEYYDNDKSNLTYYYHIIMLPFYLNHYWFNCFYNETDEFFYNRIPFLLGYFTPTILTSTLEYIFDYSFFNYLNFILQIPIFLQVLHNHCEAKDSKYYYQSNPVLLFEKISLRILKKFYKTDTIQKKIL